MPCKATCTHKIAIKLIISSTLCHKWKDLILCTYTHGTWFLKPSMFAGLLLIHELWCPELNASLLIAIN